MPGSDAPTCEVKIEGAWHVIGLAEAATRYATALKRCPACHGRMTVGGAYSGPNIRRTLYHRRVHSGCPNIPHAYSGTPSPHPQAIT